ncbi:MAG: malate dehydrogenase [Chromatiales bacterium 21-64-14]|nr:MAG: malate dehydrogenase [Chromatiales bacterium 21-64-14]HQU16826.1 malic enzyme-like NAD(P)-binding protein [Gammaproteobacteria bacterium]
MNEETLKAEALRYHAEPRPGKISVAVTKPCATRNDLRLAYTPGVAAPVRAIVEDPENAYRYTAKGNLVAVITNGSAVLGLGKVGPLAAKPVMEGKAVLFKVFADLDVFDIEVDADTPQAFIDTVVRIAPTFGGINLEDIAAPQCFEIEQALIEQLDIPVFHDDQHGTAIIVAAGLLNALELQDKTMETARIVCLGAGAAGIASMRLLIAMGAKKDHILMVDRQGVLHLGREDLNPHKWALAADTDRRTLAEALEGADVFVGVSGAGLVSPAMVAVMAPRPIVFALANPDPEIHPEDAHRVRDDLIMATGRSDYPNQVNNVLGFPYIMRGALDVRARGVTQGMQVAAVHALRELAREPVPKSVLEAYGLERLAYGPEYILPKPVDPRLIHHVAPAVAWAAVQAGVARVAYPAHYPRLEAAG